MTNAPSTISTAKGFSLQMQRPFEETYSGMVWFEHSSRKFSRYALSRVSGQTAAPVEPPHQNSPSSIGNRYVISQRPFSG